MAKRIFAENESAFTSKFQKYLYIIMFFLKRIILQGLQFYGKIVAIGDGSTGAN